MKLDGIGHQHREAQGEESKEFKSYFDKIVILPGGYVIYTYPCTYIVLHYLIFLVAPDSTVLKVVSSMLNQYNISTDFCTSKAPQ